MNTSGKHSADFSFPLEFNATFTCDDEMEIFADGQSLGTDSVYAKPTTYHVPGNTRVLSVVGKNAEGLLRGILGSTTNGQVTDRTWKCSSNFSSGWNSTNFDDQDWPFAREIADHGDYPWGKIPGIAETAKWIWANNSEPTVCCRLKLQ